MTLSLGLLSLGLTALLFVRPGTVKIQHLVVGTPQKFSTASFEKLSTTCGRNLKWICEASRPGIVADFSQNRNAPEASFRVENKEPVSEVVIIHILRSWHSSGDFDLLGAAGSRFGRGGNDVRILSTVRPNQYKAHFESVVPHSQSVKCQIARPHRGLPAAQVGSRESEEFLFPTHGTILLLFFAPKLSIRQPLYPAPALFECHRFPFGRFELPAHAGHEWSNGAVLQDASGLPHEPILTSAAQTICREPCTTLEPNV